MCSLVGSIRADRACTWDRPQAARALIAQAQATQVDLDSTNHLVDRHESDSESRVARCLMPIPRAEIDSWPGPSSWCQAVRLPLG